MSTSRGMPDYDQALKRLLLRAHDAFLALIAPGVTFRGGLSPELPAVGRQADLAPGRSSGGKKSTTARLRHDTRPP